MDAGIDVSALWWTLNQSQLEAQLKQVKSQGGSVTRLETPPMTGQWTVDQLVSVLKMAKTIGIGVYLGLPNLKADFSINKLGQIIWFYRSQIIGVEIGNEPNNPNFYKGTAAQYVEDILEPNYKEIKLIDPSMTVVGGVVALVDKPYITQLIAADALRYMDAFSVHPYAVEVIDGKLSFGAPVDLMADLKWIESVTHKPLWVTEFGYEVGTADATEWDTQALNDAKALPYVKTFTYYCVNGEFAVPEKVRM